MRSAVWPVGLPELGVVSRSAVFRICSAPTGRTIPAQGSALGCGVKKSKSPEGATYFRRCTGRGSRLQGFVSFGCRIRGGPTLCRGLVSVFAKVRAVRTRASGSLSSVRNGGEGRGEEALRNRDTVRMGRHPSPRPAPRSCLTGRGRRTRYSARRFRHELSQRLIRSRPVGAKPMRTVAFRLAAERATADGVRSTACSPILLR